MGIGGISIPQLLIILAIIILIFGGKRLRNLGGDLGEAIKGFKKAMAQDSKENDNQNPALANQQPKDQEKHEEKEQTQNR